MPTQWDESGLRRLLMRQSGWEKSVRLCWVAITTTSLAPTVPIARHQTSMMVHDSLPTWPYTMLLAIAFAARHGFRYTTVGVLDGEKLSTEDSVYFWTALQTPTENYRACCILMLTTASPDAHGREMKM